MTRTIAIFCLIIAAMAAARSADNNNGATVTKWADRLAGPQGLAVNKNGDVFVVENGAGRVTRFDKNGKKHTIYAEGLRAPAFVLCQDNTLYIGERDGNAVAAIDVSGAQRGGLVSRLAGGEIVDPLGLVLAPRGELLAVSHRSSVIRRFAPAPSGGLTLEATPFYLPASGAKYGWRDLAVATNGTLYVSDELSNSVLRRKPGEKDFAPWATGLSSPSGLLIGLDGAVYVTEEGNGRVSRLDAQGKPTVLAEGLGKAREAVFLDAGRTLLVSDRAGGVVWKIVLPVPGAGAGR